MRLKVSIISFSLTLTVGVCLGLTPSILDRLWPSFTRVEAPQMVGRRVRHYRTERFRMMKCLHDKPCLLVNDGEYGTVIGIEPVPAGGYFLKVRWDHPADHYVSYFGRYTHRESLVDSY